MDLVSLIAQRGYRVGAELGVWRGVRTQRLLAACPLDRLYLVDPWTADLNVFSTNEPVPARMPKGIYLCTMSEPIKTQDELDVMAESVCASMPPHVTVLRMPSWEAAPIIEDGALDFVLWDAVHVYSHLKRDLEAWLPKVHPGGIFCGIDYQDPGVQAAVRETPAVIHDGSWYINV